MARYHGPKARINRRLGALIYETHGASKALERRENPPGMHVKGGRKPGRVSFTATSTSTASRSPALATRCGRATW